MHGTAIVSAQANFSRLLHYWYNWSGYSEVSGRRTPSFFKSFFTLSLIVNATGRAIRLCRSVWLQVHLYRIPTEASKPPLKTLCFVLPCPFWRAKRASELREAEGYHSTLLVIYVKLMFVSVLFILRCKFFLNVLPFYNIGTLHLRNDVYRHANHHIYCINICIVALDCPTLMSIGPIPSETVPLSYVLRGPYGTDQSRYGISSNEMTFERLSRHLQMTK